MVNVRAVKNALKLQENVLYTRYPIVARRAWPTDFVQPLGRMRRASKGILHTRKRHAKLFSDWILIN